MAHNYWYCEHYMKHDCCLVKSLHFLDSFKSISTKDSWKSEGHTHNLFMDGLKDALNFLLAKPRYQKFTCLYLHATEETALNISNMRDVFFKEHLIFYFHESSQYKIHMDKILIHSHKKKKKYFLENNRTIYFCISALICTV